MSLPGPVAAKLEARRRLPVAAMRRAIRLNAGLTQSDTAAAIRERTGRPIHRETVARWESGDRTPRGDLLLAYVDLLDELRAEQP